jgi:hypothetical protein
MSLARLVITAVTVEARSKSEVARNYGVTRVWVQKLVHRFQGEGEAVFMLRSRRPHGTLRAGRRGQGRVALKVELSFTPYARLLGRTARVAGHLRVGRVVAW